MPRSHWTQGKPSTLESFPFPACRWERARGHASGSDALLLGPPWPFCSGVETRQCQATSHGISLWFQAGGHTHKGPPNGGAS